MKLSIVVSIYNEEQALPVFIAEFMKNIKECECEYELIFVNDGSIDSSQTLINQFIAQNQHIKSIQFARNFGHEAAMIAGIDYAKGDAIICMDSDLQHPLSLLPQMLRTFNIGEYDVINMVRKENHTFSLSALFYKLLNRLIPDKIAANASDFFLISKRVADILRTDYRERNRFLRGIIQIIGFKKTTILFESIERTLGKSKYNFFKLISFSITAIASMSTKPLKAGIYLGIISSLFSFILAVYSIIMRIIEKPVSGYTTIVVFLGIMFSIQFFILGILGEYIGLIFYEQKNRPLYTIEKTSNI